MAGEPDGPPRLPPVALALHVFPRLCEGRLPMLSNNPTIWFAWPVFFVAACLLNVPIKLFRCYDCLFSRAEPVGLPDYCTGNNWLVESFFHS